MRPERSPAAIVTSRRHPLVERCRRLARGEDPEHVLLDGAHLVGVALECGWPVDTVLALPPEVGTRESEQIAGRAALAGVDVVRATRAVIEAASPVRSPTGIVAIAGTRPVPFEALLGPAPALVVVACDVQDPGNVGAIVRAADACGATGVAAAGSSADPLGWKALRGAMGSALRVPLHRERDAGELLQRLSGAGLSIVAASGTGGGDAETVDWRRPVALLVGNEGAGLPAVLAARVDQRVSIPMRPGVESLNVAVATGILLYEARRQRRAR